MHVRVGGFRQDLGICTSCRIARIAYAGQECSGSILTLSAFILDRKIEIEDPQCMYLAKRCRRF